MSKLTAKQRRFVDEYLIDLNATKAAARAGYSLKTANEQGARLLAKVSVQTAVAKRMADRSKRTFVDQDRVVNELSKIAFSNITDYLKIEEGEIVLYNTDSLPADALAALNSIKKTAEGITVSVHDKLKGLELLGKHLGMFKDKIELSGNVKGNNPYAGLTTEQLIKLAELD